MVISPMFGGPIRFEIRMGSGLGLAVQQLRCAPNAEYPSHYPSEIVVSGEVESPNEEKDTDWAGEKRYGDSLPPEIIVRGFTREMIDELGGPDQDHLEEPKHQQQRNSKSDGSPENWSKRRKFGHKLRLLRPDSGLVLAACLCDNGNASCFSGRPFESDCALRRHIVTQLRNSCQDPSLGVQKLLFPLFGVSQVHIDLIGICKRDCVANKRPREGVCGSESWITFHGPNPRTLKSFDRSHKRTGHPRCVHKVGLRAKRGHCSSLLCSGHCKRKGVDQQGTGALPSDRHLKPVDDFCIKTSSCTFGFLLQLQAKFWRHSQRIRRLLFRFHPSIIDSF